MTMETYSSYFYNYAPPSRLFEGGGGYRASLLLPLNCSNRYYIVHYISLLEGLLLHGPMDMTCSIKVTIEHKTGHICKNIKITQFRKEYHHNHLVSFLNIVE